MKHCNNLNEVLELTDYYLLDLYSEHSNETYQNTWEQTRFLSYVTAQVQSTKKLKVQDIIQFNWDMSNKKHVTKTISDAKKTEMFEKMKAIEHNLNLT